MVKYSEECWKTYLVNGDAKSLVQCIYLKAQQEADKKADGKYVVNKGTRALVKLTIEARKRGQNTSIPLNEIRREAGVEGGSVVWPWTWEQGADVVRKEPGHKAFKIREEFFEAMKWLTDNITDPPGEHSILELQGLGKKIWTGIDAQDYVNRERSSWGG